MKMRRWSGKYCCRLHLLDRRLSNTIWLSYWFYYTWDVKNVAERTCIFLTVYSTQTHTHTDYILQSKTMEIDFFLRLKRQTFLCETVFYFLIFATFSFFLPLPFFQKRNPHILRLMNFNLAETNVCEQKCTRWPQFNGFKIKQTF